MTQKKKPVEKTKTAKPRNKKPLTVKIGQLQHQGDLEAINKRLAQSQAELEAAYRQYTDLYDFAPVGYLTLARDGTICQVNLVGANLLGVDHDKVSRLQLGAFVSSEFHPTFGVFFERLLSGEGKETCELVFEKKGKGLFWARLEATCFEGGEVCRAMLTDITERRRMEQALQESENRFRMLLQDVPAIAVQGYAIDGTTQYWNVASEKLYGYSAQEAIGQNLLDLIIPPEMRSEVWQAIQQMGETGHPIPSSELSLMRKGGSRVPVYSSHAIVSVPGREPELFCLDVDLTERKQAEKLLRESEWRTRIVSELTTDYIFVVDVAPSGVFKLRWASDNLFRMTGRTIEEAATSDTWGSIIHPDDITRFFDFAKQIQSTAEAGEFECRTFYKFGGERWIRIYARPQVGKGDKVETIVGAIQDITERKHAEEQLKESEKRFRNLVETTSDWIWEIDTNGVFTYVSPRIRDILGFEPSEVLGKKPDEFMPPEEAQRVQGILTPIFAARSPFSNLENKNLHKDGRVVMLETSGIPIVDTDGVFCGYRGIDRDITERKQVEEKLAYQANLLANVNDAIIASDAEYRLTAWNPAAEALYGWKAEEVLGRNGPEIIQTQWPQEDAESMRRMIAEAGRWRGEATQVRRDGTRIPVEISSLTLRDASGRTVGYISVNRDITHRKQSEDELRRARESLMAMNLDLETALAREKQLAHTDPLTGINNRRRLYELAEYEFEIALRYRQPLSVIMFDLDHFKEVNDIFGHAVGDHMLQRVTQIARSELRSADVIGRYGGEEFVIVLPMTNAHHAYPLAERIRTRVAAICVPTEKGDASVTVSIGIVEMFHSPKVDSIDDLIRRADEAMYAAKQAGRNRTEVRSQESDMP